MKPRLVASLMLCFSSVAAADLVQGRRYDFYQKNGQNLLAAELLEESEFYYTVRLAYLPRPLRIARQDLLRPPQLSPVQSNEQKPGLPGGRHVRLNAQFGYSAITLGSLYEIFPAGFQAALGADWHGFALPRWRIRAFSLLGLAAQYEAAPRSIRQLALLGGPQILLYDWQRTRIVFTGSALAGASLLALQGYTFSAQYTIFSMLAIVRAEIFLGRVTVGFQMLLNYLFDQSLIFSSSGLGVSVQYAFTRG